MKTSCITHLAKEPIVIIRQSYNKICKNNVVASALISFFEYWHNIKLEMQNKNKTANDIAEAHGDNRNQDETLYQFHNYKELSNGIMGIGGETKVRLSIKELQQLGIITLHRNPNPRYKFDNTTHYLFHPEVLQTLIDSSETTGRADENTRPSYENTSLSDGNEVTIPEITTKITTKITKETPPLPPKGEFWDDEIFSTIKKIYPHRATSIQWTPALRQYEARVREGCKPEDILAGVKRYALAMDKLGNINTQLVMEAKTFLGRDRHFELDWDVHESKPKNSFKQNNDFRLPIPTV